MSLAIQVEKLKYPEMSGGKVAVRGFSKAINERDD